MKTLITTLFAIVFATAANAGPNEPSESWTLHQHKAWEVEYVLYQDQTAMCLASYSGRYSSFMIFAGRNGAYMKFWEARNSGANRPDIDFYVQIDGHRPWHLEGDLEDGAAFADLTDYRLLQQIAEGRTLTLHGTEGEALYSYSLSGSKAAIFALAECSDRL